MRGSFYHIMRLVHSKTCVIRSREDTTLLIQQDKNSVKKAINENDLRKPKHDGARFQNHCQYTH